MFRNPNRVRVQLEFKEPSLTKQAFRDQCDINEIIKRFKKTCGVDVLDKIVGLSGGVYGDFTKVSDYQSALNEIRKADEVFGALPGMVRDYFKNDAAYFLDFCQNPANLAELVRLGLAKPPKVEKQPESVA